MSLLRFFAGLDGWVFHEILGIEGPFVVILAVVVSCT